MVNAPAGIRPHIKYIVLSCLSMCHWLDCFTGLSSFWKTATLGQGGIWGIQFSVGYQNSAELALIQTKGSRAPAAHPHPKIPKVRLHCGKEILITGSFLQLMKSRVGARDRISRFQISRGWHLWEGDFKEPIHASKQDDHCIFVWQTNKTHQFKHLSNTILT